LNDITSREQNSPISQGPFINYGPGGLEENWGGGASKKIHDKEEGFQIVLSDGGGLEKINLFHQIILVKETNIVHYLVLM